MFYCLLFRHAFGVKYGVASCRTTVSTEELYGKHPFPNVLARIRARRLRQYVRILAHAPPSLILLLSANAPNDGSFGAQIIQDMCWLHESRSVCEDFNLPLPDNPQNHFVWYQFVKNNGETFRKYIQQSESTDMIPLALEKPKVRDVSMVECPCCQIQIMAYKLNGHLAKVHKHRNPVKPYVAGSVCVFCMTDYQTRAKLVNHLCYHAPKCREQYLNCMPLLSQAVFEKEEELTAQNARALRRAGRSQSYSPYPATRVPGPLLAQFCRSRKRGPYKETQERELQDQPPSFLFLRSCRLYLIFVNFLFRI